MIFFKRQLSLFISALLVLYCKYLFDATFQILSKISEKKEIIAAQGGNENCLFKSLKMRNR